MLPMGSYILTLKTSQIGQMQIIIIIIIRHECNNTSCWIRRDIIFGICNVLTNTRIRLFSYHVFLNQITITLWFDMLMVCSFFFLFFLLLEKNCKPAKTNPLGWYSPHIQWTKRISYLGDQLDLMPIGQW